MDGALSVTTDVTPGAPLQTSREADPCAMVLFGATGDLAKRKLVPGLFNLFREKLLPRGFSLIGVGRSVPDLEGFREMHREATAKYSRTRIDPALWDEFAARLGYVRGDADAEPTYRELTQALAAADKTHGSKENRLYYCSVPPSQFPVILEQLRAAKLIYPPGKPPWSRVMIEKPFGRDLETARALNAMAASFLDESQIYRIDHYLGKETVQNILVLRFGNAIFEPIWNRKYIDHVQITASEELGVEGRGKFYDETGALRDVVQNHLLEILALVAMEPPVSLKSDDQRDERIQVFRSLRKLTGDEVEKNVVRGQYRGYRDEPFVDKNSRTPTYAALKANIDNWRWQGVPFYLRAGKRMGKRMTEVAIQFQGVPVSFFGRDELCQRLDPNVLTMRIQPDEGITLRFTAKAPGDDLYVANVTMDFSYAKAFAKPSAEAYEKLFLDCMRGDTSLFARRDGVERAWEFITPILEAWDAGHGGALHEYAQGSTGPEAADELLARDRRLWRPLS
jgi:glucose-6-phosphate 1-dehydrogenase